jgi:hypothetical protein
MTLAEQIKQVMEGHESMSPNMQLVFAGHIDSIRQLTDIVKQQHEVLLLGQQFDDSAFCGESGEKNKRAAARGYRRKRKAVLTLSAPIVKESPNER